MSDTLGAIIDKMTEGASFDHRANLCFNGVCIRVMSNSPKLANVLKDYFSAFVIDDAAGADIEIRAMQGPRAEPDLDFALKEPEPGKHKIKEAYKDVTGGRVVRKLKTGMLFVFGGGRNLVAGDCERFFNQVVNFINNRLIEFRLNRGDLLGHASAIVRGNAGMAIAGNSGAGKSSLGLHALNRGADFVSNDRVLIRAEGERLSMDGVGKHPRINPGTILANPILQQSGLMSDEERRRYLALPQAELWTLERKYDARVDRIYGAERIRLHAPLTALMVLNCSRHAHGMRIDRVDIRARPDLLESVVKSPGLFYLPQGIDPAQAFRSEAYVALLSKIKVFEASGGVDFESAADACLEILETSV